MKRSRIDLADVADLDNLAAAFWRAARGKRMRPDVRRFARNLDANLARMRSEILAGTVQVGRFRRFRIHDPKPRTIHAPSFPERVLHHALISRLGPVIDQTLVDDTYACRPGCGALLAVRRAQHHLRRFPWYAKFDIRGYYPSIDQGILLALLARRLKGEGLSGLLKRIVASYHTAPGKGLPIGSLTSQHFANYYLDGLDRLLLERLRVCGYVRYMDDVVFWTQDRRQARQVLDAARQWLWEHRRLCLKSPTQTNRSARALTFCGFRISRGALRLTPRRRQRYARRRAAWERAYADHRIDARQLQAGYSAALAITAHADAAGWRRVQLLKSPPALPCEEA